MSGDTFSTFFGEFLVNPVPIEISFNYCSHSCPMCFANLNSQVRHKKKGSPLRYADIRASMNLLKDYHQRDSLEAFWLREGYPVLISNKVDPFSNSNYRSVLPLLELMTALDFPITFQSRGGKGIDEALQFLKPSVWYITIDHASDTTRQQTAPSSPPIESRFELIEKLIGHGHKVVLGLNPLSLEWMPDPAPTLQRCKDLGVWGVWIELLHFNKDQAAIAREQGIIPEAMLQRYEMRRKPVPEPFNHFLNARQIAREVGLETYSTGQCTKSAYFDVYKATYPKLLPTLQDWVNHCWEKGWNSSHKITFEDFANFFEPLLPKGRLRLGHYIGAVCHDIPAERGSDWDNWMTARELLRLSWSDPRVKWCPVRAPAFSYLAEPGWQPKDRLRKIQRDSRGNPVMAFWPEHQEFLLENI